MSEEYFVELAAVDKRFTTRHILQRDENTGARRLYWKKHVTAMDAISFGIRPGEVFGLLGPNGAGKTTTVKTISGLVRPDAGKVLVRGRHVEKKRLKTLRQVGVVLEGTRTSIWPLTPLENLNYFGNLKDVKGKVLKQRRKELLDFIGLTDKMNVQVRRLSRGQRQKLAICIALIADPSVVLLDEPTTGLDVQSSRAIKDKIRQLTREQGKSILVTTHDMNVAQEICDRIGIIKDGQLVTCQPTEELLELFTEQVYEFRLDAMPDESLVDGLPFVTEAQSIRREDGPLLVVGIEHEPDKRSETLYALVERLRAGGFQLRSVSQRQQTLENVFLRLTGDDSVSNEAQTDEVAHGVLSGR